MQKNTQYDVLIVGGGPAGLFAALEILKENRNLKVCLIDRGKSIRERTTTEVLFGIGGSGAFSDGKLHYTIMLSHDKILGLVSEPEYEEILDYVDMILTQLGVDAEYYPKNSEEAQELVDECERSDIKLYVRKVRHVGSDKLPQVIGAFENLLREKGLILRTETEINDLIVQDGKCLGIITNQGENILAKQIVLATGRPSAAWLRAICSKYAIGFKFEAVEIGVRVEFPAAILERYSRQIYDPVFFIRTPGFDDTVRTFCTCPNGYVAIEEYDKYVCVNGHSNSTHETKNSNFAFLTIVSLTEPVENTIAYGESIAELANTIGGGKPLLQRLKDFKSGRRSTWDRIHKSFVKPTLLDVTPGDISMALPYRTVSNILQGLEILDKVMPGIDADSTLLYAPEIKFRSSKLTTTNELETPVRNLYVAGDGAGLSGNIVGAAATGVIVGRSIVSHCA